MSKSKSNLKIYYWPVIWLGPYTPGCAVAVAGSLQDAIYLVMANPDFDNISMQTLKSRLQSQAPEVIEIKKLENGWGFLKSV